MMSGGTSPRDSQYLKVLGDWAEVGCCDRGPATVHSYDVPKLVKSTRGAAVTAKH